jgi:hypothetical protein
MGRRIIFIGIIYSVIEDGMMGNAWNQSTSEKIKLIEKT